MWLTIKNVLFAVLVPGTVWYAGIAWLGFHLFVLFYEEPTLKRLFGAEYDAYRARVRRWLPGRPYS